MKPKSLLFMFLLAGLLGGCFGQQEINLEARRIIYIHGGFLSFGILVIKDIEADISPAPAPNMGAGAIGN